MSIERGETITATFILEDENGPIKNAQNPRVYFYRPDGTLFGDEPEGIVATHEGEGVYTADIVPDVGGIHWAVLEALDPASQKKVIDSREFYVRDLALERAIEGSPTQGG